MNSVASPAGSAARSAETQAATARHGREVLVNTVPNIKQKLKLGTMTSEPKTSAPSDPPPLARCGYTWKLAGALRGKLCRVTTHRRESVREHAATASTAASLSVRSGDVKANTAASAISARHGYQVMASFGLKVKSPSRVLRSAA